MSFTGYECFVWFVCRTKGGEEWTSTGHTCTRLVEPSRRTYLQSRTKHAGHQRPPNVCPIYMMKEPHEGNTTEHNAQASSLAEGKATFAAGQLLSKRSSGASPVAAHEEVVLEQVQHGVELAEEHHAVPPLLQHAQHAVQHLQLPAGLHHVLACMAPALILVSNIMS